MSDSHGVVATNHDRYLWALDRHANVAEIIDLAVGQVGEHGEPDRIGQ